MAEPSARDGTPGCDKAAFSQADRTQLETRVLLQDLACDAHCCARSPERHYLHLVDRGGGLNSPSFRGHLSRLAQDV